MGDVKWVRDVEFIIIWPLWSVEHGKNRGRDGKKCIVAADLGNFVDSIRMREVDLVYDSEIETLNGRLKGRKTWDFVETN